MIRFTSCKKSLKTRRRLDLLDCSSAGNVPGFDPYRPAGLPGAILGYGSRKEPDHYRSPVRDYQPLAVQAEEIISNGRDDLVYLAREFPCVIRLPFVLRMESGVDVKWPDQIPEGKKENTVNIHPSFLKGRSAGLHPCKSID